MTIDDDSSIYVGGLPYDATEESVRSVFDLYGAVVAVKIINDQNTRGKCYGFITFTNPRSAVNAINEMDGRSIAGRVVRVNKVKTRYGRPMFDREGPRRNMGRGTNWDSDRGREREYDPGRYRHKDRSNDWIRERDRSRDHDMDRERGYEHGRDQERDFLDTDRDLDKELEDNERERSHDRETDPELERGYDFDEDLDRDITNGHAKSDKKPKSRQNGNLSSESNEYDDNEVKEQLQKSTHRLEELKREITLMEEATDEKEKLVADLQRKSLKLEDALIAAKKRSSYRQMQLMKLHKCFIQVEDYTERLKSCKKDLQSLVESTMLDSDVGADIIE